MKSNKLQDLTIEELQKKEQISKTMTYLLGGVLILLICLNLYNNKGLLAVPLGLSPILILNIKNLKDIRKELNLRDVQ